jgi:eukaryotic-like serine/threonine-protein kinase
MKRFTLPVLALIGAVLLSACGSNNTLTWAGLTADANNAYLSEGPNVYAVRLSDGSKVWQYAGAGGEQFYSNPVLTPDGQLLVGSVGSDHGLVSLDLATGNKKWSFAATQERWFAPPLAAPGMIYAPNNDGTLYAISPASGQLQWSLPISKSLWGAPVTDGKLVYLTSLDHFLYAVDPAAHKLVWKTDLGGLAAGGAVLSPDAATLYAGSFAGRVFAINAADGSVRWSADTLASVWNSPSLSGSNLYAADVNGQVYALSAADGKNAWPIVQPDGPMTASPLVRADGSVAVGTDSGSLYVFDPTGKQVWTASIGGKIYTSLVASGDNLLVAPYGADFLLAAVNKDGSILWKFTGK